MSSALPESQIYSFLDREKQVLVHFLEGQKLIQTLAVIHQIHGAGFAYFREVILSIELLMAQLKAGEQTGFYLDSEEPYFRLKIELNAAGLTRGMLYPENFNEFPEHLRGLARTLKFSPHQNQPYQSIVEIQGVPLGQIVNQVLRQSYQINSQILISPASDQSVMIHQLPALSEKAFDLELDGLLQLSLQRYQNSLLEVLQQGLTEPSEILRSMEAFGFQHLGTRPVRFQCNCSQQQMILNLLKFSEAERTSFFDPGETTLEVVCEYCKSRYSIDKAELTSRHFQPS